MILTAPVVSGHCRVLRKPILILREIVMDKFKVIMTLVCLVGMGCAVFSILVGVTGVMLLINFVALFICTFALTSILAGFLD
jgi:hypothetical protein